MTLNNSSLIDIVTVVAYANATTFLYSRDNEAVQKLNGVTLSGL